MKKVGLLLFLGLATLMSASAQEAATISSKAGSKTTFVQNGFGDNWFIGAGARASVYFGDMDQHADFLKERPTLNGSLFVGKWLTPVFGARLSMEGGALHSFTPIGNDATSMQRQEFLGAHVDAMFNVTNFLCKYNSNRFYNFIPYVGIGYAHGFKDEWKSWENNTITFNAGLLNTFRITNKLSAFVELSGSIVDDEFDGEVGGDWSYEGIGSATAGIIINFGGKTVFNEATLLDQGQIDDLNRTINQQRSEIAELSKRPKSCPPVVKCPDAPVVETKADVYVPNVVFFRIGSAAIDKNQEINIFNTAEYLKANSNAKVKVVGYADKGTGSANINMKLSEKRAKNVANALINKYGISSDRVSFEWKGSAEQPYQVNEWNRVAIFFAD